MRLPDWRKRLTHYLASTSRQAYRPGQFDCILFAAGGREALTGVDVMAGWRGRYDTVEEGLALAQAHGCDDPFAYVVDGLEEIPPAYAQVGDIAMFDGADGLPALGIVAGPHVFTVHPRGSHTVAMTESLRAWRV